MLDIKAPILMYHRVAPDLLDPSIESYAIMNIVVSQRRFEQQIQYLSKNFTLIRLPDLALFITEKRPIPENSCVITFDDNYKDHYTYAFPLLKKYHIPATFFLEGHHLAGNGQLKYLDRFYYALDNTSLDRFDFKLSEKMGVEFKKVDLNAYPLNSLTKIDLVKDSSLKRLLKQSDSVTQQRILTEWEKALQVEVDLAGLNQTLYLSKDEIAEMAAQGMELGAHTMSHLSLAMVNLETARREIFQSGDFVKKLSGQEKVAFAHPFGEGADSVEITSLLQEYGFYAACTVEEGFNTLDTDVLNLKRVGMLDYTIAEY